MKRKLLLIIVAFSAGFLTHALVFPDFLANGIVDIQQIALPNTTPTPVSSGPQYAFETKITYKDGNFNRHNITMGVGTYLMITNISTDHLMWLTSSDPELSTPRGYAESEQIKKRMDQTGQFVVADKNNPSERLVITVK